MTDSQPRPAALVVINPSGNRNKVLINETPFQIGRQSDSHLTLRDNRISRAHARISYDNGYHIEDLNSRHGTFVNGEKIQRKTLHSSDRVEFGFADSYKLLFLYDDDEIGRLLQQIQTGQSLVSGGTNLGKLRAMVEVARTLQNSFATNEVLAAVVDAALTITNTTRGYLILREDGHLKVRVARDQSGRPIEGPPQINLEVLEGALARRRDFLTVSVPLPDGQTAVTVPLVRVRSGDAEETHVVSTGDNTVGVLFLEGGQVDMSAGSGELLQTLALEASTVLENARLLDEEREKQRLDEELSIARQIQQSLLPDTLPSEGWFRAAGSSIPSHQVGGDYFDIRLIAPDCWSTVVADVSGKGVSSAILASLLQGAFLGASPNPVQMPDLISRINRYVLERAKGEKYATILYALMDGSGLLSWVNAGHCTPMVVKPDGRWGLLETNGLPVGMIEPAQFVVHQLQLEAKDKIVFYSDGLTDAQNLDSQFFTSRRVRDVVQENAAADCRQLHDKLLEAVRVFTEGGLASDDITVVVLEYLPAPQDGNAGSDSSLLPPHTPA
jgi:serine phosphatase RsbU (regulator of sigma subunit)